MVESSGLVFVPGYGSANKHPEVLTAASVSRPRITRAHAISSGFNRFWICLTIWNSVRSLRSVSILLGATAICTTKPLTCRLAWQAHPTPGICCHCCVTCSSPHHPEYGVTPDCWSESSAASLPLSLEKMTSRSHLQLAPEAGLGAGNRLTRKRARALMVCVLAAMGLACRLACRGQLPFRARNRIPLLRNIQVKQGKPTYQIWDVLPKSWSTRATSFAGVKSFDL